MSIGTFGGGTPDPLVLNDGTFTDLTVTGTFTSSGIDDDATTVRLKLGENTGVTNNNGVWIKDGSTVCLVVGSDNTGVTLTDATNKNGRIGLPHYTNAEEPVALILAGSNSSTNDIFIGGNSSSMNTASTVGFYTAANNTTVTGTLRYRIQADGDHDFQSGQIITTSSVKVGSYTVATVPSASGDGAGSHIFVTDETGGATGAYSDGTNWRRYSDRAIVS